MYPQQPNPAWDSYVAKHRAKAEFMRSFGAPTNYCVLCHGPCKLATAEFSPPRAPMPPLPPRNGYQYVSPSRRTAKPPAEPPLEEWE